MKKIRGARKAIVFTSVAVGFFFGVPLVTEASELKPVKKETIDQLQQSLRYGHIGLHVRLLQIELKKLQLYHSQLDGIFGPKTQASVKQLQNIYHLRVDGIAGQETLKKLKELRKYSSKPICYGDRGPQVKELQLKLKKLNYYQGIVDGVFGPITKESVIDYQKHHLLIANGVADPLTLGHIFLNKNIKGKTIKTKKIKPHSYLSVQTPVISIAKQFIGVPYKWGGASPNGFDCSGFLQYVFAKKGMKIPRTVNEIWNYGVAVQKLSVGDIVFFQT
jgi:peptidoglycan hydrolase-like protein with peptidoglycan-binding domain